MGTLSGAAPHYAEKSAFPSAGNIPVHGSHVLHCLHESPPQMQDPQQQASHEAPALPQSLLFLPASADKSYPLHAQ